MRFRVFVELPIQSEWSSRFWLDVLQGREVQDSDSGAARHHPVDSSGWACGNGIASRKSTTHGTPKS